MFSVLIPFLWWQDGHMACKKCYANCRGLLVVKLLMVVLTLWICMLLNQLVSSFDFSTDCQALGVVGEKAGFNTSSCEAEHERKVTTAKSAVPGRLVANQLTCFHVLQRVVDWVNAGESVECIVDSGHLAKTVVIYKYVHWFFLIL